MTGMLLYFAFGLMVLTVLSNRYWSARRNTTRGSTRKAREKLEEMTTDVATAAEAYAVLSHQFAEAKERTAKAEQELQQALALLEAGKARPVNRLYVFDRLEPRPGRFWEVAVRHLPQAKEERLPHRTWTGTRRYLLVADSERDARERAAARFPRKAGFETVEVRASTLAGLSVNRTTKVPGQPQAFARRPAEDKAAPAVPRRAMVARN